MPERDSKTKEIMIEVGERIKKARTSRRLTQTQVGELAGDANLGRRMTMYEKGEDHMNMVSYFKICKALGVTPNDLAPRSMFPAEASFTREFLSLTENQQKAVMIMIETLGRTNGSKVSETDRNAEESEQPK